MLKINCCFQRIQHSDLLKCCWLTNACSFTSVLLGVQVLEGVQDLSQRTMPLKVSEPSRAPLGRVQEEKCFSECLCSNYSWEVLNFLIPFTSPQ